MAKVLFSGPSENLGDTMNMSKKLAAGIFLGMTALAGSVWAVTNGTPDTIIPKDGKKMKL